MHFQYIVHHKKLRNPAHADELPDEFVFGVRIENLNSFVALKNAGYAWAAVKIVLNSFSRLRMVCSSHSCTVWMRRQFVNNRCLSPVSSVHLTGSSFLSALNRVCKSHHLFFNKWYLGNKTYLFRLLGFPNQQHSRRHCVGLPAFMFMFDFRWHSSKGCTRTYFNYFWGFNRC